MLSALSLLTLVLAAEPEPNGLERIRTSHTFRWGADPQGGAPYAFQDPMDPNRFTGFEVELADLFAKKLGAKARPVFGPYNKLLDLLARGDFDVGMNGLEVADEKKRVALLSKPYFTADEKLTVRRNDAAAPRALEALQGRRVGTLPGTLAARILERAGADVRTYEGGQDEIYDDLKLGRTDAVLLDHPASLFYGEIDPEHFETVPGNFGQVQYAIAVPLGDDALKAELDKTIDALAADGSFRKVYERWGIWNQATAQLFGDKDPRLHAPAEAYDQWRLAVGKLPPFFERVRTRYPQVLPLFFKGAGLTLLVSLCAMAMAIALGISLAMTRRYAPKPFAFAAAAYIEFFRGTPLLVQLTMIYFGLPELGLKLNPFFAGVVALGLNYAAAEAENYRAGLESVPAGQLEASTVLGLSRWQTLRHIVAPQAVRISLPPMTNDFIALLKDSSLVSLVTLTELTKTYTNLGNSMRDHLGLGLVVAVFYLLLGLPFAQLARKVEAYFGRHLRRAT